VGENRSLLRELAAEAHGSWPKIMLELRAAIDQADGKTLVERAHQLCGALAVLHATAAATAAAELERLGRKGALGEASHSLGRLETELKRALDALDGICLEAPGGDEEAEAS
jgi:HPt (histidine-containing phosphotransfer) domain-containing protein